MTESIRETPKRPVAIVAERNEIANTIASDLRAAGFEVCRLPGRPAELPLGDSYPVIVTSYSANATEFLEEYKAQQSPPPDSSTYILLLCTESDLPFAIELLGTLCDDILVCPYLPELLGKKVAVGMQHVRNWETFQEVTAILERYSHHIDQVAAERSRQLIHAERLSTLGLMSAEISHEINTPLAYASRNLELARTYSAQLAPVAVDETFADRQEILSALDRIPDVLEKIEQGLDRVSRLTSGLKRFGRESQGVKRPSRIEDCVHNALEICEGTLKNRVSVVLKVPPGLPDILADSQRIEQVLVNLFVNASHALEGRKDAEIRIRISLEETTIRLTIEDNGPGIPPQVIETIWEPFYTTKESGKGTGLGLSISRSILREHGGSIAVSNNPDGGAKFELTLPITPAADPAPQS